MSAREEILRRVRVAQVPTPGLGIRRKYSQIREHDDRLAQFVQRVEDYKATVIRTRPDDVAAAVATCLTEVRTVVVPPGFDPSRERTARTIAPTWPSTSPSWCSDPGRTRP